MWGCDWELLLQAASPLDALRIDGRPSKLVRNQEAYAAAEAREGMIAWNGNADNMIDRFDGRALLDFYKDPDPRNKPQKADEELELEEVPAAFSNRAPHWQTCCVRILSTFLVKGDHLCN